MTVNSLTPDLMVEDIEATVEWYQRVFDAEVVATLPADAEEYFWAQVMVGESPLMFQERSSLEEKLPVLDGAEVGGSVALYLDIDDAEALYDDLESAGAEVVSPVHETDFGWRQFAVTDCNGYVLWFGERLDEESAEDIGREYRTYHHEQDVAAGVTQATDSPSSLGESERWG